MLNALLIAGFFFFFALFLWFLKCEHEIRSFRRNLALFSKCTFFIGEDRTIGMVLDVKADGTIILTDPEMKQHSRTLNELYPL